MKLDGKKMENSLEKEHKRLSHDYIKELIKNIETKIIMASMNGYDYTWYRITDHYKYDNEYICHQVIKVLEKHNFYVRLFNDNLLQIIW